MGHDPPPRDRLLVALDRPGDRDLRGPSQVLQQPRRLALAVRDAELLADDPGDPVTGPDVPPEAVRLGTVPEEVGDQVELLGGQLGSHATPVGVGGERLRPAVSGGGQPLADRTCSGAESGGDVALEPSLLMQFQRPHPPPLPPVMRRR
jgi:hypothetical protein